MTYLFEPVRGKWIRNSGVLGEVLWTKQTQGIPLQQSDIPTEKVLEGRFELPDFCEGAYGFRFVSDRGRVQVSHAGDAADLA